MAPQSSQRLPELDGVRGLACLMVLVWHYAGATLVVPPNTTEAWAWEWGGAVGRSGVDLFFVLSGFLIGGILLDHRDSPSYFRTFYVRRVCRIFPVYYLVVLALLAVVWLGGAEHVPAFNLWLLKDLMPLASYPTFTQNFFMAAERHAGGKFVAMTWSVAVEEQFYLLFPLVVRFLSRGAVRNLMLLSLLGAPLLRLFAARQGLWAYTLLPCRIDCLAAGVLGAFAVRDADLRAWLVRRHRLIYGGMAACLTAAYLQPAGALFYSWLALLYGLAILLVVVRPDIPAAAIARQGWLRGVGLISYGVYMYHQPINGSLHALLLGQAPTLRSWADLGVTCLSFVATFAAAWVSYHAVEKHLLRLGHRATWYPDEVRPVEAPSVPLQQVRAAA